MSFVEKIKFGTVYRAKNIQAVWSQTRNSDLQLNDQRYNLWIPIFVPGRSDQGYNRREAYYMIDTYQVDSIYSETNRYQAIVDKFSNQFRVDGSSAYYRCGNYYYNSCVELNDYTIDLFEEYIDLKQWHPISEREAENYDDNDIVRYIKLFNCHNYPSGIILCRNDAQVDYWNSVESVCREVMDNCSMPRTPSDYMIEKLKDIVQKAENSHYNKDRVIAIFKLIRDLDRITEEFEEMKKSYVEDLTCYHDKSEESWIDSLPENTVRLGDTHPDIERYLREDCYCPGEVYSFDGFGYMLFNVDDQVIPIGEHFYKSFNHENGLTRAETDFKAFIKKFKNGSQIVLVIVNTLEPDKVFDMFRMDATYHNYKLVKSICETGTFEGKFDTFKH